MAGVAFCDEVEGLAVLEDGVGEEEALGLLVAAVDDSDDAVGELLDGSVSSVSFAVAGESSCLSLVVSDDCCCSDTCEEACSVSFLGEASTHIEPPIAKASVTPITLSSIFSLSDISMMCPFWGLSIAVVNGRHSKHQGLRICCSYILAQYPQCEQRPVAASFRL